MPQKILLSLLAICLCLKFAQGQVGINTTIPGASLDIVSNDKNDPANNEGILIPRLAQFPTSNPTTLQNGMLIFLDTATTTQAKGFYYWDAATTSWVGLSSEWVDGKNSSSQNLIYAKQAKNIGSDVVITDQGYYGIGTDTPISELHVKGTRTGSHNQRVELTLENANDEVEIQMIPSTGGVPYSILTGDDSATGLEILEENNVKLSVRRGGAIRVTDLNQAENAGITFPAKIYADANGELFVRSGGHSRLLANTNTVAVRTASVTDGNDATMATTTVMFQYILTPTEDIFFDASYDLSVLLNQTKDPTKGGPDNNHSAGLYGAYFLVNGTDHYAQTGHNYTSTASEGYPGHYYLNGKANIPLDAGTTYTIQLFGYVVSPLSNGNGWQATFGSGPHNRVQLLTVN